MNLQSLSVSLSANLVVASQDGTPGTVNLTINGADAGSVSVAASNLPPGVTSQFLPNAGGLSGTLSLVVGSSTPAGTYFANVTATSGGQTASQSFMLVVAVAASVANSADQSQGNAGMLEEFMSTSFQPSQYSSAFFQNHTATEPGVLNRLGPQHIRLQAIGQAVPMSANTGAATDWDFATLDAIGSLC